MNYFLLLNRHKNIARKRQADYKRNLIVVVALIFSIIFVAGMLFAPLPEEDLENFAPFLLPALVFFDFSVRFVIKKNAGAGIFPYLTLPVPRKSLIWHIVLADLQSLWIWGCWLIYCVISGFCGVLTFWAATELLFLILINNYLIAFVKSLIGGYALLTFPLCLLPVFGILLIINLLSPIFAFAILALAAFSFLAALFYSVKQNLYKELNLFAL